MKKLFLIIAMALSMVTMSWAKDYNLWVNFTQVTDDNKDDILGNGVFSFNPDQEKLTLHGGSLSWSLPNNALSFFKGYIIVEDKVYGNDIKYLGSLTINVEHSTTLTNTTIPSDSQCRDAIYSTVPTYFTGGGTLTLKGFCAHCIHVKNDLIFDTDAGSFILQSGMNDAPYESLTCASHCIYQEGSKYKLYLRGGQFYMWTLSDRHSDRASVMRYDGGVDESGIGSVDYSSHLWGIQFEHRGNDWFNKIFHDRKYLSEMDQKSISHYVYNGIQEVRSMKPVHAPVSLLNGHEWSALKDYYKDKNLFVGEADFIYYDGVNRLELNSAKFTLPMGLLCELDQLKIACYGNDTLIYSGEDYALNFTGKNIMFQGIGEDASLTIIAPACIKSTYGFTVDNMTLNCLASGEKAINITSTSTKEEDHTITVTQGKSAGEVPAKLHAKATKYPIYGVKKVAEGTIYHNGKVQNDVIVDQKGNAMTDVTIGYETTYPVQVNGEYLTPSLVEYYQDLYGKSNFVYDPTLQILAIRNVDAPNMKIYFLNVDKGTLTLYQAGTNNLRSIVVNQSLVIGGNGTLNVNNTNGEALMLHNGAKVTFSDQTTANFSGSTYGVIATTDNASILSIRNATATFKGGTQSVKNIQSISAIQSVLTAPANASFSYDLNTIVVGGTPTKEKVVYSRTESSKPVFNIDAYIGQEDNIVADVKVGNVIELTAKVTGNGSAAGEFRWQVYSEEYGWTWLTTKQSITKAELINGKLITQKTTIAQSDPSQKLMRAVVTNSDGTETAISNVITLNALYQIFLYDDGYKYYLNGDKASAQSVTIGGGDNVWMHTYDTLYLEVDEDARECFMDFESDEFNIFGGENYVYYTYDVTSGRIDVTTRTLKIEYYSSRTQIDESTLVERIRYTDSKPVYCGSTLKSSSHFSPAAPKKTSPFVGWMDMSNQAIYDRDALDTLELYYDKVFCAIYEEDITYKYGLSVNGDQITSDNCDNILGDGTAYYDNGNKTLTLNNASISYAGDVIAAYDNINIECIGQNKVEATDKSGNALYEDAGSITILGTGSVSFKAQSAAINLQDDLTIKGGCTVTTESANGFALTTAGDSLTIDGATLIAKGNGKAATINGCNGLMMNNGVAIRSGHTYDKTSHKFLNNQSQEAKDDIIIGVGGTGIVNVNANVNANRKVLRDGQLIIIREGKTYNAQGTRL